MYRTFYRKIKKLHAKRLRTTYIDETASNEKILAKRLLFFYASKEFAKTCKRNF